MSGYETRDAPAWLGLGAMIGLIGLVVVSLLAVAAMLALFQHHAPARGQASPEVQAPGPRLESAPRRDRLAVERQARARLESHGGIERAMARQAERGWPDAETAP